MFKFSLWEIPSSETVAQSCCSPEYTSFYRTFPVVSSALLPSIYGSPHLRRNFFLIMLEYCTCYLQYLLSWFAISRYVERWKISPIHDVPFWGCSQIGRGGRRGAGGGRQKGFPSLKSVTYNLQWWNLAYLYFSYRTSKKYVNHVAHPLNSADISIFLPGISKFCYIKKYRYRLYFDTLFLILLTFRVLKDFFSQHCYNFDDAAKMATLCLLKIKVFWSKGYQQKFITWLKF